MQQEEDRDEEARRAEWIEYYVDIGDFAAARSLGWEGNDAAVSPADAPAGVKADASGSRLPPGTEEAAVKIQARYRAHAQSIKYKDDRNEAARLQWIEYYVSTKQYDAVRSRARAA